MSVPTLIVLLICNYIVIGGYTKHDDSIKTIYKFKINELCNVKREILLPFQLSEQTTPEFNSTTCRIIRLAENINLLNINQVCVTVSFQSLFLSLTYQKHL